MDGLSVVGCTNRNATQTPHRHAAQRQRHGLRPVKGVAQSQLACGVVEDFSRLSSAEHGRARVPLSLRPHTYVCAGVVNAMLTS